MADRVAVVCALVVVVSAGDARADTAGDILALTGGRRTRLVWCRYHGVLTDIMAPYGGNDHYTLIGFDTDDGVEREILSAHDDYTMPMFTHDGSRVVYADRLEGRTYVVNWDGTGHHAVADGWVADVWMDPNTGLEWTYNRMGDTGGPIWRFQIDNPTVSEIVWDLVSVGDQYGNYFTVSADGTQAGGAFPWPDCGVANLSNETWEHYGDGCSASLAPDDSYLFMHMIGTHQHMAVFDAGGTNRREVYVSGPIGGANVWYPKWSNDRRFMTVNGPYDDTWLLTNEVELYLERLDAGTTAVEAWVQVTDNTLPEAFGDAWIAGLEPCGDGTCDQPTESCSNCLPDCGPCLTPSVVTSKSAYGVDETIVVQFNDNDGDSDDWVGLYSDGSDTWLDWQCTDGGTSWPCPTGPVAGSLSFSPAGSWTPGTGYNVRLFSDQTTEVDRHDFVIILTDDVDPTVAITSPVDGATLRGTVTVLGSASDDVELTGVEVRVDAGPFESALSTDNWSYVLDTTAVADGAHTLTARATDGFGNQTSASVGVTVDNRPAEPSITLLSPTGGEIWEVGSTQRIEWTTENLDDVRISYSTDDGLSWTPIATTIDTEDPEWGSCTWTVPDEPSEQCRIFMAGYFGASPTTSELFEIRQPTADDEGAVAAGGCSCVSTTPTLLALAGLLRRRRREPS